MKKPSLSVFLQAKLNTYIFKYCSPCFTFYYLYLLGLIYFNLNKKERLSIQKGNSDILGDKDKNIEKNVMKGIIRHYFEKLMMAYYNFPKMIHMLDENVEIKGRDLIDRALVDGNGVILVTAHFGALEYLPLSLALKKYKINMAIRFKTAKLKKTLENRADQVNIKLIDCCEHNNILFNAIKCLSRNEIYITECDEVDAWSRNDKYTTTLFDKKVFLDRTIDLLVKKTNAKVLTAFLRRNGHNSFVLEVSDVDAINVKEDNNKYHLNSKVMRIFEQYVTTYPDQWYEWKSWEEMKVA